MLRLGLVGLIISLAICAARADDPVAGRLGMTHVAGDYALTPVDYLNEGAGRVLSTGSRVIKAYLFHPGSDYPFHSTWPGFSSMVQIAQHPYYVALFSKPFDTYVLTAYSFVGSEHYFRSGVSDSQYNAERQQFFDLAYYLLTTYNGTGKTFVLQHWEGDWALRGTYSTDPSADPGPTAINGMIRWLNARQDGVNLARQAVPGSDVKVYHACEVNLVQLAIAGRPTVTNDVLPYTYCDLYSYSAYDTIGVAQDNPTFGRVLFRAALDYIASKAPDSAAFGNHNVYIGEFGWPEVNSASDPGASTARQRNVLTVTTEESLAWGCPYVLYWQTYDNECRANPPTNADCRGFWLLKPDGSYADAWYYFASIIHPKPAGSAIVNPSFEGPSTPFTGWQVVHNSGEGPDDPPWTNGNTWNLSTPFGTHFVGKITNGLTMDFYLGQVVDVADDDPASSSADWQLRAWVQLHGRHPGDADNPTGVHQTWEIGWNTDGSVPDDITSCDHYQTLAQLDGSYTGNDRYNFVPLAATGTLSGARGLRGVALRVRCYNDAPWNWSYVNVDNVDFAIKANPPVADSPDFDLDGDVDVADFGFLQLCFNGPNRPLPTPSCVIADFDADGDVDLSDFATFLACFNGPNRPPACP